MPPVGSSNTCTTGLCSLKCLFDEFDEERSSVSAQIAWPFFCFSYWAHACDHQEPAASPLMNLMWSPACLNEIFNSKLCKCVCTSRWFCVNPSSCTLSCNQPVLFFFYTQTVLPPGAKKINKMKISSLFSSQRPNDDGQGEGGDRGELTGT